MLNIACVCVGDGYSPEYVRILYAMVRRNLAAGFRGRFTVFTDNPSAFANDAGIEVKLTPPDLEGWWAKMSLFAPDAFPKGERVLYFDLDTVITGPLDEIASYAGNFAILQDFYRKDGLQSSVMAWEAGTHNYLWEEWVEAGKPRLKGGDQSWLELKLGVIDLWQHVYPKSFKSYKVHCQEGIPEGCSVVVFHGIPRPHQARGWVPKVWNLDGGSSNELVMGCNVKEQERVENVLDSLATSPNWLKMRDGLKNSAVIVGGSPSLESQIWRIRGYQNSGCAIFATNGAYKYLKESGIQPDGHVICDARSENVDFVPPPEDKTVLCFYASQTHRSVRKAAGDRLTTWHRFSDVYKEVVGDHPSKEVFVGGGSTVGLLAISVGYILGFRNFLIFGMDSSYAEDSHHAYRQSLNDDEYTVNAIVNDRQFKAAPWMVQQAEEFMRMADHMKAIGCRLTVYGEGLIPYLASQFNSLPTEKDLRANSILSRLEGVENPKGAEVGVFAGDLSKRLLARPDLHLTLVDSWTAEHPEDYAESEDFHSNLTQEQQDEFYRLTCDSVYFAHKRVKIIRRDSLEAAKEIPDESLDFVFIDANHSYEGCKKDIEAWSKKVKKGGLIAGHDYENTDYPKFGVKRAVDEMFTPSQLELGENFTWFVRRD